MVNWYQYIQLIMVKTLLILPIILMICISTYCQEAQQPTLNKLEWLLGKWNRSNAKPGQNGTESWTRISNDKWEGYGITLKGKDTLFAEKLQIIAKKDGIYYVADVAENKEPVYFKCTEITATGFVCENALHDFPKKIAYALAGNHLKVIVSGNGKSIDFEFMK